MKCGREMQRFYKDSALLTKRKAKNVVYVWKGNGYILTPVYVNSTELSIEELAYICCKSNKGYFVNYDEMQEMIKNKDVFANEYNEIEGFTYCDLSSYGLQNGYLLIENIKAYGVEIHS